MDFRAPFWTFFNAFELPPRHPMMQLLHSSQFQVRWAFLWYNQIIRIFLGRHTPSFHTLLRPRCCKTKFSQHATPWATEWGVEKKWGNISIYQGTGLLYALPQKTVTLFIGTIKSEVWLLSITNKLDLSLSIFTQYHHAFFHHRERRVFNYFFTATHSSI